MYRSHASGAAGFRGDEGRRGRERRLGGRMTDAVGDDVTDLERCGGRMVDETGVEVVDLDLREDFRETEELVEDAGRETIRGSKIELTREDSSSRSVNRSSTFFPFTRFFSSSPKLASTSNTANPAPTLTPTNCATTMTPTFLHLPLTPRSPATHAAQAAHTNSNCCVHHHLSCTLTTAPQVSANSFVPRSHSAILSIERRDWTLRPGMKELSAEVITFSRWAA